MTVITALLRITEIENSRGKASFAKVALADLVQEVGDLYDPIAEDKHVTLRVTSADNTTAYCDRDLLFEAVANLVDKCGQIHACGRTHRSFFGPWRKRKHHSGFGHGARDRRRRTGRGHEALLQSRQKPKYARSGLGSEPRLGNRGFRLTLNSGTGCVAKIACPVPSN